MKKYLFISLFFSLFIVNGFAQNSIRIFADIKWYGQEEEARKMYLKGGNISTFSLKSRPDYQNQVINQIKLINAGKSDNISISTSGKTGMTDLMFLDRKLISISEEISSAGEAEKKSVLDSASKVYGRPQVNDNGPITNYNYEKGNTKLLIQFISRQNSTDVRIFYYAADLFEYMLLY